MRSGLVLTLIGSDRPGIVEALSRIVAAHDANWERSRMVRLAGRFAGVLEVAVDDDRAAALSEALRGLESEGLQVVVDGAAPGGAPDAGRRRLLLDLVGNDRPGIIREVSRALADRGVNVEELSTECGEAPMSGGTLFHMQAELSSPPSLSVGELRSILEAIANDLMVEISLGEPA